MYFLDVIFNFSRSLCVLPSTLCMTGELWPGRFIWYQDIRVTHCQSSSMSCIFTQYSFCNSFRHSPICPSGWLAPPKSLFFPSLCHIQWLWFNLHWRSIVCCIYLCLCIIIEEIFRRFFNGFLIAAGFLVRKPVNRNNILGWRHKSPSWETIKHTERYVL